MNQPHDYLPQPTQSSAADIAIGLLLLHALIVTATAGHGTGGSNAAMKNRLKLFRQMDHQRLFGFHFRSGMTAISILNPQWREIARVVLAAILSQDGVELVIDPTEAGILT